MNDQIFEQPLFEEEGTSLDLKKEQYRFFGESDEVKSELLKDILGFAESDLEAVGITSKKCQFRRSVPAVEPSFFSANAMGADAARGP